MGALADWVYTQDSARLKMWALAIAVAVAGFNTMVGLGWIAAQNTLYAASRLPWLSILLGGVLFGWGMVFASGCGSRTLTRLGAGNLKALVVLGVMAFSAMVTLHGLIAVANMRWIESFAFTLSTTQDLPSILNGAWGWSAHDWAPALSGAMAVLLLSWVWASPSGRTLEVWCGGLGIGALVIAYWWLSGVWGYVAEHPETLEPAFLATRSNRMESFTFIAPVAYLVDWFMYFSDQGRIATMAMVTIPGVILGATLTSILTGTFRWQSFQTTEDFVHHLLGGLLMGMGGVMALGCTIGQGITGISTLSVGSFLALAGILVGGVAALKYQMWRVSRAL